MLRRNSSNCLAIYTSWSLPTGQSAQLCNRSFFVHPDRSRFETSDLWIEHPERRGFWQIVGCTDGYVYLAHGEGLHASSLEPEIEHHEFVKAVFFGGHGHVRPVLLVELLTDAQVRAQNESERNALRDSLQPCLQKVNAQCHPSVQLFQGLVLFAKNGKPFVRTTKASVARVQTLQLYLNEMSELYKCPA